jgi:hypothetical protein
MHFDSNNIRLEMHYRQLFAEFKHLVQVELQGKHKSITFY